MEKWRNVYANRRVIFVTLHLPLISIQNNAKRTFAIHWLDSRLSISLSIAEIV